MRQPDHPQVTSATQTLLWYQDRRRSKQQERQSMRQPDHPPSDKRYGNIAMVRQSTLDTRWDSQMGVTMGLTMGFTMGFTMGLAIGLTMGCSTS